MAKVLSVSSQVVYGHVGNSTAAFVLQRMGHEVLSLPTVLLSNRPGYGAIAGEPVSPAKLDAMLGALWSNGWLAGVDAILTGYIPTAEHAVLCERWIKALDRNALYVCDPIVGDEPGGVYIREDAACAIREKLVPLADVLTPNLFELGWLTGRAVADAGGAVEAARSLWKPDVIVTSAPAPSAGYACQYARGGTQRRRLRLPARDRERAWHWGLLRGHFPGAPAERLVQPRGASSGFRGDEPCFVRQQGTRRACVSRNAGRMGEAAAAACPARAAAGFHDAGWIVVQRARRLDRLHNAYASCVRPVKRRAPPECGRSSGG